MEPQTASELGLTNAQLYKLERAGQAEKATDKYGDVLTRKTPGRGRPAVLWLVREGAEVEQRANGGLEAARAKRSQEAADKVWEQVQRTREDTNCKCSLRPGMTWDELQPLGSGCTDSRAKGFSPGWVCSALDQYRRLVPYPQRDLPEADFA